MPPSPQQPFSTKPHTLDLTHRGFIKGVTYLSASPGKSETQTATCHYFGGIPYALPPIGPFRWMRPRELPPCYRYGTRANPGSFTGECALCPQPGFRGPSPDEGTWDEDCLQCNVWVPAEERPDKGWPVFFYIHGGWLQFGSPNGSDFRALLRETKLQCIFVCPAYRVNLFGFLSGIELEHEAANRGQTCGNYGFWDQRLALEWTYKNISYFGGNPTNITIAGYSAGAHSTFHQLAHDLFHPVPIIKRAIMFSNGAGMQPKSLQESQLQFNELLTALSIPSNLSTTGKLARLRAVPPKTLLAAADTLKIHEFRAVTDGQFVRKQLFHDISSGEFAKRMLQRGVELQLGECRDEHFLYAAWRPPSSRHEAGVRGLQQRLVADYPAAAVAQLMRVYCPDEQLPVFNGKRCADWDDAFGHVYADLQVHALQRGFVDALCVGGAAELVHRYRVEWRARCCDAGFPVEWGVTHATDLGIWFQGNGMDVGLLEEEKEIVRRFVEPFVDFVKGDKTPSWGAAAPREMRRLGPDGVTGTWVDSDWDRGLKVWNIVRDALREPILRSKL